MDWPAEVVERIRSREGSPRLAGLERPAEAKMGRRWAEKIAEVWPKRAVEVGRSLVAEVCPKVPFLKIIYHYLINIVARGSLSHFRHALLRKLRYS